MRRFMRRINLKPSFLHTPPNPRCRIAVPIPTRSRKSLCNLDEVESVLALRLRSCSFFSLATFFGASAACVGPQGDVAHAKSLGIHDAATRRLVQARICLSTFDFRLSSIEHTSRVDQPYHTDPSHVGSQACRSPPPVQQQKQPCNPAKLATRRAKGLYTSMEQVQSESQCSPKNQTCGSCISSSDMHRATFPYHGCLRLKC